MEETKVTAAQSLATKCLKHLQREEQLLVSLQAIADGMRGSLKSREYSALEEISKSSVTDNLQEVAKDRTRLQAQISAFFEVPREVATLSLVVQNVDLPTAQALLAMQTRLSATAASLNRTLVATGNLARRLHELIECVFRSLGGEAAASIVYERSGRHGV